MFNIDQALKAYKNQLKAAGLSPEKPANIFKQLDEYNRTKSIKLAADIIENLKNYKILTCDEFENLTELASLGQHYKSEKVAGAVAKNSKMTPQQRSEHARKMAIARWNRMESSKLIKDIK